MRRAAYLLRKLLVRAGERLLDVPLSALTFVIPRSPTLWAFGSTYGRRFADNPKYLFLFCHADPRGRVKAVWLTRSRAVRDAVRAMGLPAHHQLSPAGLWYALRAGVYVMDCRVMDVSSVGARGALKVNLWHGIPLKRIEADIDQDHHPIARARRGPLVHRVANRLLRPQLTERYDVLLATSHATAARLGGAFLMREEQVLPLGYPRSDALCGAAWATRWRTAEERAIADSMQQARDEGRRVLLYMPTFRDWKNDGSRELPLDWSELDRVLASGGGVLYCKLHPSDQRAVPRLDGLANIRLLPSAVDVYTLLGLADALVSDYSSVFFDFLLLDRPLLFYPYDLEEYQRLSRSLYDRYEDVTPGPKVATRAELTALVRDLLADYDGMAAAWREARAAVRARFHAHVDADASARLVDAILARVA